MKKHFNLYAAIMFGLSWYSHATIAQNPTDFCGGLEFSQIPNTSVFRDIVRLSNHTFVAVGIKGISTTQNELYLANFDICFDTLWVKFYGSQSSRYTGHFITNIDANSFAVGCSYAPNYSSSQNFKCLLLKFNLEGDTLWSKTYSLGIYNEGLACIISTDDSGFMIGGFSNNFPDNNAPSQAWLIKTDSEGNIEWNKTYGFSNASERITGIIPNADGGYTIAAARYGGAMSTWVFKTDSVGNILWNRIHGNGNFTYPYTIKALHDGYLIAGIERIYGYPDYGDGFLLKLDSLGYQQWFKLYGGPFTDGFTALHV